MAAFKFVSLSRWCRRGVWKIDAMHCFPILSRHHFNRIPRTTVKKSAIGSLARAFLTSDAQIRIDLNASEGWMVFVGHPKHTSFDGTVFDASG